MTQRADIVGLDSSILMHPTVWKASGHTSGFTDPLIDCKNCKFRFRELKPKDFNPKKKPACPKCGSQNLTEARPFNLMFKTYMGPLEEEASVIYLRPETAQGIFTNFENILQSCRKKIPFGIAQIGKAFRNEITPGHFIFRTREFEQMEMQYFTSPGSANKHFETWRERRWNFYMNLGMDAKNLKWKKHQEHELAHYASHAYDVCYRFPFGWEELEGIHNRGDFDLSCHQKESGKKIEYFSGSEKFIPHVIETSAGCDRLCLALLVEAYIEEKIKNDTESRLILKLPFSLAPFQVAILPLSKKEDLCSKALKIRNTLTHSWSVDYDQSGSIGKRYRRQDEIGTPFCVTVDFDSIHDQKVTIRNRDSMKQVRILTENLKTYLSDQLV